MRKTELTRREALGTLGAAVGAFGLNANGLWGRRAAGLADPHGLLPACVVTPQQTEGPYFVDERLERADIRVDPTDGSVKQGLPMQLALNVQRVDGGACTPVTGAMVDVWQCDVDGAYSNVRDAQGRFDTRAKRFLRGFQLTDAAGKVEFRTIFPGWYQGRTPHIHFKVRLFAGSQRSYEFTSQLYFEEAVNDRVYGLDAYASRGPRSTRNAADGIFQRENGSQLILSVAEAGEGLRGTFDIGLRMS
jgi:protocatechuate 3,4-dioxygenase beta subunit